MKYDLAIFAGGLGTRLLNTEDLPKPLVNINGLSLLSRIIISFNKTGIFKKFYILTCFDADLFSKILRKEIPNIEYLIYEEGQRAGRLSALMKFFESKSDIEQMFVCNGDTFFLNLDKDEIINPLEKISSKPITYLVNCDSSRNDYKVVRFMKKNNFQNSGFFFINKNWLSDSINKNPLFGDIDDHLFFDEESSKYALLSTSILDCGTPPRLSKMRSIIK